MNVADSQSFGPITATTAAFNLQGGKYAIVASATWGGGSVTLQVLAPDGATYVTAATAITASGLANADLPPGKYKFAVATATAVYVQIARVPY